MRQVIIILLCGLLAQQAFALHDPAQRSFVESMRSRAVAEPSQESVESQKVSREMQLSVMMPKFIKGLLINNDFKASIKALVNGFLTMINAFSISSSKLPICATLPMCPAVTKMISVWASNLLKTGALDSLIDLVVNGLMVFTNFLPF